MSFDARREVDISSLFNVVIAREGLIFAESITLEDEAGVQIAATVIQNDPFDRSDAKNTQHRRFRVLSSVTVNRGYKILQTTNGEVAYWWVKDVVDDREGVLYLACERAVAKG